MHNLIRSVSYANQIGFNPGLANPSFHTYACDITVGDVLWKLSCHNCPIDQ